MRLFKSAVDAVASTRDIRVKQMGNPWMTLDILSRIKKRDPLLSLFKRDRSDVATYQKNFVRSEMQSKGTSSLPSVSILGNLLKETAAIRGSFGKI